MNNNKENSSKTENSSNKESQNNTENSNNKELSQDDIKIMLDIIVVISKRGGFQLEEYKIVSELYEKLKLLLN